MRACVGTYDTADDKATKGKRNHGHDRTNSEMPRMNLPSCLC